MEAAAVLSGLVTGLVVGMTGVGGGAIMTPVLILLLGVAPSTAIGTDLLFATATKVIAVGVHRNHGTVDWLVVRRLAAGSVPGAAVTVLLMHLLGGRMDLARVILPAVGGALVLTSVAMVFRARLHEIGRGLRIAEPSRFKQFQPSLTVVAGGVLGILVALTSIGAGALGAVILTFLYPLRLTPAKLVGTDLAHAIPVAFVAGIGHFALGNVDFALLGWLLLGSVPGVWAAAHFGARAPEKLLRHVIAGVLLIVGLRILL